ncbi:hypothetical protein EOPP23_17670 [Endozoicomonas sp. OPT23]|uniref:hypothetical protein n=1 Tax=Endozoicomonas sp. OPT23 TaxID=2072845 RepID=UPI00129A8ABC|nr:hypothetical protein [Endozoicomonas sp. OPT23]MRI34809.1 hypothetical protein [Endozoicomonas sp. OPT23]
MTLPSRLFFYSVLLLLPYVADVQAQKTPSVWSKSPVIRYQSFFHGLAFDYYLSLVVAGEHRELHETLCISSLPEGTNYSEEAYGCSDLTAEKVKQVLSGTLRDTASGESSILAAFDYVGFDMPGYKLIIPAPDYIYQMLTLIAQSGITVNEQNLQIVLKSSSHFPECHTAWNTEVYDKAWGVKNLTIGYNNQGSCSRYSVSDDGKNSINDSFPVLTWKFYGQLLIGSITAIIMSLTMK